MSRGLPGFGVSLAGDLFPASSHLSPISVSTAIFLLPIRSGRCFMPLQGDLAGRAVQIELFSAWATLSRLHRVLASCYRLISEVAINYRVVQHKCIPGSSYMFVVHTTAVWN